MSTNSSEKIYCRKGVKVIVVYLSMSIIVLGGGITGLTTAYELAKKGLNPIVLEKDKELGGLAGYFNYKGFQLEKFYHHIFQSDSAIIGLSKELGLEDKLKFRTSKNAMVYNDKIYNITKPLDILKLPIFTALDRVKLAKTLAKLKLSNFESWMEEKPADKWLTKEFGEEVEKVLFRPLFKSKFGRFYDEVPLTWFWARLKFRTVKLGYWDENGFGLLIENLRNRIEDLGGKIITGCEIKKIDGLSNPISVVTDRKTFKADKVVSTLPLPESLRIINGFDAEYVRKLINQPFYHALNLVLILKEPISDYYWVSLHNEEEEFLAWINHTNLIPKEQYKGLHPVYLANYLPIDDPRFDYDADQLLTRFEKTLKKIAPKYDRKLVVDKFRFVGYYGQPIVGLNHGEKVAPIETPLENVYLASMSQVYPQDRGTNYAVDLGQKAADIVLKNN